MRVLLTSIIMFSFINLFKKKEKELTTIILLITKTEELNINIK